ncbi:hypothetical protein MASR2M69_24530 [Bacteroidota bacterium]
MLYFCIIINIIKVMSATDLYTLFYQWINTFNEVSDEVDLPSFYSDYPEELNISSGKDNRFTVNY